MLLDQLAGAVAALGDLTESAGDFTFGERREVELKGLKGKQGVYEVVW